MPFEDFTGFVLAGGRSQRMGVDKAVLSWGDTPGATLLDHMVHLLSEVTPIVRVVGPEPLPDILPGRGPLEGIRTALEVTTTERNLIVAVDLPFLEPALLRYLAARHRRASPQLLLCRVQGYLPLCVAAHRSLRAALAMYLDSGERSVQEFVATIEHAEISEEEFHRQGFPAEMFRNVNTPEDYERAKSGHI